MNWGRLAFGLVCAGFGVAGFVRMDASLKQMLENRRLFGSLLPWKLRDLTPTEIGNRKDGFQALAVGCVLVGVVMVVTSFF
jgi:hypothetical protein